jgi:hypothetical protein
MAQKVQIKLYVEDEQAEGLRADAAEFGLSSAQDVIAEVLRLYLPFWRHMKEAGQSTYEQQAKSLGVRLKKEEGLGKETAPAPAFSPRRARR